MESITRTRTPVSPSSAAAARRLRPTGMAAAAAGLCALCRVKTWARAWPTAPKWSCTPQLTASGTTALLWWSCYPQVAPQLGENQCSTSASQVRVRGQRGCHFIPFFIVEHQHRRTSNHAAWTMCPPQRHLSTCLECIDTGRTSRRSSFPVACADLHLSAPRTTRRRSQRNGPANCSPDSRSYIRSWTGEQFPPSPEREKTKHGNVSMTSIVPSFSRLESRMTADINVILQLLQRQIAPVPPAYSTVSPSTLPAKSPGQYGTGTPVLRGMYPISPIQMEVRPGLNDPLWWSPAAFWVWCLSSRVPPTLTLSSPASLRSPSPAAPMRPTPHSPASLLKPRATEGRSRWRRSHRPNPPPRPPSCAPSPTAPLCQGTWTSPQDRPGSRSTSQTPRCPSSEGRRAMFPAWPQSADVCVRVWRGHVTSWGFSYHRAWTVMGTERQTRTDLYYWHDYMQWQQLSHFTGFFFFFFTIYRFYIPIVLSGFPVSAFNLMCHSRVKVIGALRILNPDICFILWESWPTSG